MAQTCGVLSLLSGCPIRQSVAVTGSMNADGELLPVGGITEKIEGFYDFCCGRSPKEIPGVLFPADNQKELYLAEDVRRAVERGEFRLYPVRTLEEAFAEFSPDGASGVPAAEPGKTSFIRDWRRAVRKHGPF